MVAARRLLAKYTRPWLGDYNRLCQGLFSFCNPGIHQKASFARVAFQFITLSFFKNSRLPGAFLSHPPLANRQNCHLPGSFFIPQPWHPSKNPICQGYFHTIQPWQIDKMTVCQGHSHHIDPGISQKISFARVVSTSFTPGISLKLPFARVAFHSTPLAFPNKSHLPGSYVLSPHPSRFILLKTIR